MAADKDAEMASAQDAKDNSKAQSSEATTTTATATTVQGDIQHNLTLLRSAVSILEPRLTTKVLRTLGSIRKRLNGAALREVIEAAFPPDDKQRAVLLGYIKDAGQQGMEVDSKPVAVVKSLLSAAGVTSSRSATPSGTRPGTPLRGHEHFVPEEDIYLTLLVIVHLLDTKKLSEGKELVDATVVRLGNMNRRTLDQLAARVYFYYARLHEIAGDADDLASIRPHLLAAQRVAALRKDDDLQATLLNLLLRNYFAFNLYDQADKLIAKTTFPDTAGNNQLARWLYYVGRLRAIQLNYTEAHTHLQQAIRRAPHATVAPGFLQIVYKLFIVVELLMGEIPERSVFRQPVLKKALVPYLHIVQAVRVGDIEAFTTALKTHQKQYIHDGTYTLILRLRHNVIKTALRTLSLAYSRIPLQEICKKLRLDSEEEVEYICAKAIRDGVIEASLDHEKGYMKSKDVLDVYGTNEPQKAFHQRIQFCLQLHNDSIKAMRFPMKTHQKELSKAADARERERELVAEIEQNGPDDDDEGAGDI